MYWTKSWAGSVANIDFVVDADVWIYRERPDTKYELYEPTLKGKRLGISFQGYAELMSSQNTNYGYYWREAFGQRKIGVVIMPDQETCEIWGYLVASRRIGLTRAAVRLVPTMDIWHAATAIRYGVPLVSHNAKDYQGLPLLDLITFSES